MTMHLNHTLQALRSSLPRYGAELARAAARRPALAPYADADGLLAALSKESPLSDDERAEIVRAVVAEKQASKHPLWVALLVLAFAPAMRSLRGGLVRRHPAEEVDQALIAALLESAERVEVEGARRIMMSVQRGMMRYALRSLDVEEPGEIVPLDDSVGDVPWHLDAQPFVECAAREVLEASKRVPGATRALAEHPEVFGRRKSVARGATTPEEQAEIRAEYAQLKRNQRAVARLRKSLGIRGDGE